jgi:hypothetical protein
MSKAQGEPSGLARRDALRYGLGAAALVWTAPAIHRVQLEPTQGSPPPSTSTPTTTPPPTHEFAGDFTFASLGSLPPPDGCPVGQPIGNGVDDGGGFEFTADLGPLGVSTVSVTWCGLQEALTTNVAFGSFSLSSIDGTVTGTITGGQKNIPSISNPFLPITAFFSFDITEGTDAFEGATGSGTISSQSSVFGGGSGSIEGSFTVP